MFAEIITRIQRLVKDPSARHTTHLTSADTRDSVKKVRFLTEFGIISLKTQDVLEIRHGSAPN